MVSNGLNSLNNGAWGGGGTSVYRLRNGLLKNSDLNVYTALFVYNLVIGYSKRREKIIRLKAFDKKKKIAGFKSNQVLGTVLQCSYFSVISRFPLKTENFFFKIFLQFSLPTLYKVETRKKILDTRVQHCLWGEGRGWICVSRWWLSEKEVGRKKVILSRGFQACKSVVSGFWWKIVIEQIFFQLFGVFWTCFKNSFETNAYTRNCGILQRELYSKGLAQ